MSYNLTYAQASTYAEFMELITIQTAEELGLVHFQNTLVDYDISFALSLKQNMSYQVT